MRSRTLSMRFKLFFAFAVIGFITAALISIQAYTSAQRVLNSTQAANLASIRNAKKVQIETAVDTLKDQLRYFSQNVNTSDATRELSTAFHTIDTGNQAEQKLCRERLTYYYEHYFLPQISSVMDVDKPVEDYLPRTGMGIRLQCEYIAGRHIRESENVQLPRNTAYSRVYREYHALFNDFRLKHNLNDVMIVDNKGFIVYSSNMNIDFATNVDEGPWGNTMLRQVYDESKDLDDSDFVGIYDFINYIPSAYMPTAFLASPIISRGEFLGVFIATLSSSYFDRILSGDYSWEADGLGKTGEAFLVGNDLLMRSDSRYVLENFSYYISRLKAMNFDPKTIRLITKTRSTVLLQKSSPVMAQIFTGATGISRHVDYIGNKATIAYAPLKLEGLDWGIIVKMDEYETNAPLRTLQADILQTLMLVVCLVVVLTVFVSRALARPIIDLSVAITNLTEGDYTRRLNDNSTDEMGELSRAFDRMADTINERSQEILKTNNSLIDEVHERRQTELQLQQALEHARIAEKAKADFIANMSHEIRTPLNGILGFLELLQQTPLNPVQNEYLNIIDSSADSLLGVINEILDFSKIESGKMQIEAVEFNLAHELEDIIELYTAKASEKRIEILLDDDVNLPSCMIGDPLRLRQILSNLLSNAIKFTNKDGNVTLGSRLQHINGNKYMIRLFVRDTGIGISKKKQVNIFEAFSQADTSVTRRYGGTGLGLTISSQLARLMSSRLYLDSAEGEGSTFWFDVELEAAGDDSSDANLFGGMKTGIILDKSAPVPQEQALMKYLNFLGCAVSLYSSVDEITGKSDINIIFVDYIRVTKAQLIDLSTRLPGSARIVIASDSKRTDMDLNPKIAYALFRPLHMSKIVNLLNQITYGRDGKIIQHKLDTKFAGHVLVAEDNPVNQQLILILLQNLGLIVDVAEDGQQTYDMAISGHYDLIFMDIHMPIMDGITVTSLLINREKTENLPHTPIVALTANVIEENRAAYVDAGMDDFLAKPIVLEELTALLRNYLPETEVAGANIDIIDEPDVALKKLGDKIEIGDTDLLKVILREFLSQTASQTEEMRTLISDGNFDDAMKISLNIKSASLNLRFDSVSGILNLFDADCASANAEKAMDRLDALAVEIEQIRRLYII